METMNGIIASWASKDGHAHTTEELLSWVQERNATVAVSIKKIQPQQDEDWQYIESEGIIANRNRTFFTISGFRKGDIEQPIILQQEIGYLGILCKKINGVIHFLMQAKIEPGNVNKIQISPTIQATKSNFTQKHGGKKPPYLEFFLEADKYEIIVDQIQSEQSARFLGKRNRNIVVLIPESEQVEVLPSHRWMTLGQIKELMKYDNLVNMDTRTVLSCIPYYRADLLRCRKYFTNAALYQSIFIGEEENKLPALYQAINNQRMFNDEKGELIPLEQLQEWHWKNGEFVNKNGYHFKIVFCDIAIEGREVKRWTQPLFEAVGMATFGLICSEIDSMLKFLVKIRNEIGNFDGPEVGPTLQLEADEEPTNTVEQLFLEKYHSNENIIFDGILSEEGGRFYHEQNRNIILQISENEISQLPENYYWVSFRTLNMMVQHNNCLNIQLRNLLSLLEV